MKQLATKPVFLSLLLAIILWFIFDNFVVAAAVGLLAGFLVSMLYSLHVLKQQKSPPGAAPFNSTAPPPPSPSTQTPTPQPSMSSSLPEPDLIAAQHSAALRQHLEAQIKAAPSAFLPFDQWMQSALYAPGLGYYAAGTEKFGSNLPVGDFTTAPELTPFFGQTLARQIAQVLQQTNTAHVLEFGAGSGALAASIIPALQQLGIQPTYTIIEVSADLKSRQQARLANTDANVLWLDQLPEAFEGCVIANEVMDAMPVTLFQWDESGKLQEMGVTYNDDFKWAMRAASPRLQKLVGSRMPALPGYRSEVNLQAEAWVAGMGDWLHKGAALLIDYGFPRHEYYHPQRAEGTLMCHYRHQAHANPFLYPGLQDITAHVDFTAMADAALEGGLDVLGYTSQARFLINAGLPALIADIDPADPMAHARQIGPVQKLLSEAEMGELFKVLAIGKDIDGPLLGFMQGDRRDRL